MAPSKRNKQCDVTGIHDELNQGHSKMTWQNERSYCILLNNLKW